MNGLDDFDLAGDQPATYDRRRLDVEWATLVAIREMLGISLKGRATPTYEQSLAFAKALAPALFDSDETLIGTSGEPQLVQEYRQKTEALSQLESRKVPATEIIDRDINELGNLLEAESANYLLRKRLGVLQNTRTCLLPKKYTENQVILRDLFKAQRNIPVPPIEGDTYREFRLTQDRGLRIRLLHPDQPEHRLQ